MKKRTKEVNKLREVGVKIWAQGAIVMALTPYLIKAVDTKDYELHDLLDAEIESAQARVRELAAEVSPVGRHELAVLVLGFRKGLKIPIPSAKSSARGDK
jgi:hypothetical protein